LNLPEKNNGRRLTGWKSIGQYLGCSGRTAMRWESERALPVHRLPGGSRSSVWANPDELSAWLKAFPAEVQAEIQAEASSGEQRAGRIAEETAGLTSDSASRLGVRRRLAPMLVVTAAIATVVLGGLAVWALLYAGTRPAVAVSHTPYDDNPAARDLYLTARLELSTRTADSLRVAQRGFQKLVDEYPDRAAGWCGLADVYVLLPEFASEPGNVTYPKAARAARTAIALDSKLADPWLDEGFVAWWWQGDAATAFPAFATALQLDPNSSKGYHWYATALAWHGEYQKALAAIARARALDPGSRAVVADEAMIRFDSGQRTEALATLEQLVKLDPQFVSWHSYLAHAYLVMGRDEDYLREAIRAAELQGLSDVISSLRIAEERLHASGRQAMFDQLSVSEARGDRGAGYAVKVAKYRALAGDRAGTLHWLSAALAQHDHDLVRAVAYVEFEPFRQDPDFQKIVNQAILDASSDAAIENARSSQQGAS
jgi:tetratricopeptide (TPR) repeat protein